MQQPSRIPTLVTNWLRMFRSLNTIDKKKMLYTRDRKNSDIKLMLLEEAYSALVKVFTWIA